MARSKGHCDRRYVVASQTRRDKNLTECTCIASYTKRFSQLHSAAQGTARYRYHRSEGAAKPRHADVHIVGQELPVWRLGECCRLTALR